MDHYSNYRHIRLESKPIRNLPTQVHEPLTQTVVDVNWYTSEEDSELNEFRYKQARIESLIAALKEKKELYSLIADRPIVFRKTKGTFSLSDCFETSEISWEQRKQEAEALGEDQQEDDVVASADKDEIVDSKASQEIITDAVSSKEEEKK